MSDDRDAALLFLTAMISEARPLARRLGLRRGGGAVVRHRGEVAGRPVAVGVTSMGTAAATSATEQALDGLGSVDHVVMVGIAGAVDPTLAVGDVVVPESVVDEAGRTFVPAHDFGRPPRGRLLTTDELYNAPADLARLADAGVIAVDMETAAVAAVCEERSVPWSVVRAISDRAGDPLTDSDVVGLAADDGSARPAAVARWLLRHPGRVGHLVRLARGLTRATNAAAATAAAALSEL